MSNDYKIQGYIDNWLASWNFTGNPFANWEANLEPNLNKYYVKHPFYEQLLYTPISTIVFAPRGGGKTATRLMVQSECRPIKKTSSTFAVAFTDFSPLIEKYGNNHKYSLAEFLPYLLESALLSLLKSLISIVHDGGVISDVQLGELRYWVEKYTPHFLEEDYLPTLIDKIASNVTRQRIRELVSAYKGETLDKQNVTKYWSILFSFWKRISRAKSRKPDRLKYEDTTIVTLDTFVDFVLTTLSTKQRSCEVMYFLFDGIDEYAVTKNDAIASANLLSPLLSEMNFHKIPRLANKFFLPWEQKNEISHVARLDLLETHDLTWKKVSDEDQFAALRQMLRDRIRVFNRISKESLREMCEPPIRGWIEDEMLEKSDNSPRNLIRLGYLLFFEHCREEVEPRSKILEEEWNAAIRGLRTSDLYVSKLEQLYPSTKSNFNKEVPHLIRIDLQLMRVFRGEEEINLAPLELDLLVYLNRRQGQICLYNEIMEKIYGATGGVNYQNEAFRALLKRLRKKLESEKYPDIEYIRVVPRRGIILENTV